MRRESKLVSCGILLSALALYPVLHFAGAAGRNASPGADAAPPRAAPLAERADKVRRARPEPGALSRSANAKDFSRFFNPGGSRQPRGPIRVEVKSALLDLAETPEAAPKRVRVDGTRVNLRAGPGLSAERITAFDRDTRLTVLERGEAWTRVKNPETDQTGWMHGDYLETVTDSASASTAQSGAARNAREKTGT